MDAVNAGSSVRPRHASWIVTRRCNLRCDHCYVSHHRGCDRDDMYNAGVRLRASGIESVMVSGGEALLLDDIYMRLQAIRSSGVRLEVICTNGYGTVNDAVIERLAGLGVERVAISLDGARADTHNSLRGTPDSYEHAMQSMRVCAQHSMPFSIDVTCRRCISEELDQLVVLAHEVGARAMLLKRFVLIGRGRGLKHQVMTPEEHRRFVRKAYEHATASSVRICIADPLAIPVLLDAGVPLSTIYEEQHLDCKIGCMAARYWYGIMPNGDITPCPLIDVPFGNLLSGETIEEMLKGSSMVSDLWRAQSFGVVGSCAAPRIASGQPYEGYVDMYEAEVGDHQLTYADLEDAYRQAGRDRAG